MLQFHPMGLPHPGGSGRCANVFKGLRRQMAVGIPTPTPQVLHSRSYCVGQELRNPLFYQGPGMSQVSGRRVPKQGRTTCVAETPLAAKHPSRSTRPRITRATGQLPMYSQRLAPSACELACQGSRSRARLFAYLHKWCTSVTYLPLPCPSYPPSKLSGGLTVTQLSAYQSTYQLALGRYLPAY